MGHNNTCHHHVKGFHTDPFQHSLSFASNGGGDRRRKCRSNEKSGSGGFICLPFFLFLLASTSTIQHVSGHLWDGVVVTQADFQALRVIKNELIDFKGVLKSWNDSGVGACSGGWAGIKCVNGEVIAIQLPWRGLGGRISEKISQLQSLRKLSLHDNALVGSVFQCILGFSGLMSILLR